MSDYKGQLVHSALFPHGGLDVKGKHVAVIGSGATGVQIVQDLGKEDCQLTTYVRTPNLAVPMHQRKMTKEEQQSSKSFYNASFKAAKDCRSGFPYNVTESSIWDVSKQEQEAVFEEFWNRGGFSFLISNFRDYLVDKKANRLFYEFWAEKTRTRISDPRKRDIIAPLEPPHYFGTKRPSLEQDYYETLDRANVEIVDLKQTPLDHFTETGIVAADSTARDFDIVILATGYNSLTGSLTDTNLTDTAGVPLSQKWNSATYNYLGLMIDGMPNAFMVYSPQAPTSLAKGPPVIEIQVGWMVEAVKKMREDGVERIEPRKEASEKWRQDIQTMNAMTLFGFTDSWYMGANIPGKPREQLVYLAGVDVYHGEIKDALDGWKGFHVTMKDGSENVQSKLAAVNISSGIR